MSYVDPFLQPGMGDPTLSTENEFTWGPIDPSHLIAIVLVSSAVDAGNAPTTTLRPGLVLGQIAASGKYKAYDPTITDGSEVPVGVLRWGRNMLDPRSAAAADHQGVLMIRGSLKVGQLFGFDENCRRHWGERFTFDDLRWEIGGNAPVVAKTIDYQLVNGTDNGKLFTNLAAAGAVNFTLPATLQRGFNVRFMIEANQTVTITAPAGKLVAFNNAAATSIAFSTAGEKVGTAVEIIVNSDATKYLAFVYLAAETVTPTIA